MEGDGDPIRNYLLILIVLSVEAVALLIYCDEHFRNKQVHPSLVCFDAGEITYMD